MGSEFIRAWDSTDKEYDFYDATTTYGTFTKMIGGNMKIDMISYDVMGTDGNVTTKFIPGQISYSPFRLECIMSNVVVELYDWFKLSVEGNMEDLRKNCSIAQFIKERGVGAKPLIIWNLENAIPVALPGFSYHAYQKTESAKFKMEIQAESITIEIPPP